MDNVLKDHRWPSIVPEKLLRAQLLQLLYSVRRERLLMEEMNYNLLFRWFVGLNADDPVWDATVFTKNRDRLLQSDVAREFLALVVAQAEKRGLTSDEHFTVDGTLLESWASPKSFQPKDGPPPGSNDDAADFLAAMADQLIPYVQTGQMVGHLSSVLSSIHVAEPTAFRRRALTALQSGAVHIIHASASNLRVFERATGEDIAVIQAYAGYPDPVAKRGAIFATTYMGKFTELRQSLKEAVLSVHTEGDEVLPPILPTPSVPTAFRSAV